jgi:hypothetical protein
MSITTRTSAKPLISGLVIAGVMVMALLLVTPSSSAVTKHSTTATSRYWSVTLWVKSTYTFTGTSIAARLTIDNLTGHSVAISGCRVNGTYGAYIYSAKTSSEPFSGTVACGSKMSPGVHVFRSQISTNYQGCGGGGGMPACGTPPRMKALPVGTYRVSVELPGALHRLPQPRAIMVTLFAPDN